MTYIDPTITLDPEYKDAARELIVKARAKLVKDGWWAGSLLTVTGAACALGALSVAASPSQTPSTVLYPSDLHLNGPVDVAVRALAATRDKEYMAASPYATKLTRHEWELAHERESSMGYYERLVYCYNDQLDKGAGADRADAIERGTKNALAWFDRAIEALA